MDKKIDTTLSSLKSPCFRGSPLTEQAGGIEMTMNCCSRTSKQMAAGYGYETAGSLVLRATLMGHNVFPYRRVLIWCPIAGEETARVRGRPVNEENIMHRHYNT